MDLRGNYHLLVNVKRGRRSREEVNKMAKATDEKTYTLSQVAATAAELSGTDATVCGKKIRARIRSNFDDYAEIWDGLDEAKENRDGNRYPPMGEAMREKLLVPFRASSQDDEEDEEEE